MESPTIYRHVLAGILSEHLRVSLTQRNIHLPVGCQISADKKDLYVTFTIHPAGHQHAMEVLQKHPQALLVRNPMSILTLIRPCTDEVERLIKLGPPIVLIPGDE